MSIKDILDRNYKRVENIMFGNNKSEKEKRFNIISDEMVNFMSVTVVQDSRTGVNYMITQGTAGLSVTPVLDKDGKILITEV